jgi:putative ABC transport system ATP-binding protein
MPASTTSAPRVELELRDVYKTFEMGGEPVSALRGVDIKVTQGEFVAVMGPSGSGKSTLLHILGLVDTAYEGTYDLGGERVSGRSTDELAPIRNREIGFVFQAFFLLPQLSILDNTALPALYARNRDPEECRSQAQTQLEAMGLGHRLHHKPHELSIGQRQRAAIARSLINQPRVLLADEPTGALDSKTAREILDIFNELHRGGATIIMITHDQEVAAASERTIHVRDGQIHV